MSSTFPSDIIAAAVASRQKYGVPASVTLAQWAVESAWGAHMSGKNNPFGIKAKPPAPCTSCLTREVINGQTIHEMQYFADYASMTDAFEAHAKLLATYSAYAGARSKLPDAEAFANALTGVYATDPKYGQTLIGIMRSHDLADYDKATAAVVLPIPVADAHPAPLPAVKPVVAPPHLMPPAQTAWQRLWAMFTGKAA